MRIIWYLVALACAVYASWRYTPLVAADLAWPSILIYVLVFVVVYLVVLAPWTLSVSLSARRSLTVLGNAFQGSIGRYPNPGYRAAASFSRMILLFVVVPVAVFIWLLMIVLRCKAQNYLA